MPTDQDRHTLHDAAQLSDRTGFTDALRRRANPGDEEDGAILRDFLQRHSGERAARYVPLPRLIQE